MIDDEKVRVARALYLEAFDNTASAAKAWDGDGTKDYPGHASLRDRAFRKYCDLASVAITLVQSQEREVTDAMVEAAAKAMHLDEYQNGHCDTETTYRSYLSPAKAALLAAIRSSSPTQEG